MRLNRLIAATLFALALFGCNKDVDVKDEPTKTNPTEEPKKRVDTNPAVKPAVKPPIKQPPRIPSKRPPAASNQGR